MVGVKGLRQFELFADLDDKELGEVAKIASLEKLEAGFEVFAENEEASTLYLVSDGKVAVKMKSRKGQEVIIDELGPGEFFGWSAVLDDRTFTAAVRTMEDSTLVAFDGHQLRRLFAENDRLGYRLISSIAVVISSRLANLRSRLVDEPFAPEWLSSPVQEGLIGPPSAGATSEMRSMACPDCGTVNGPRAVVNDTEQYRCHNCGMVYYSPAGCETPEGGR